MPGYGSRFADVGTFIDLRAIGMVPSGGGYGVLGIIGEATRGPANQVIALTQPSDGYNVFRSGPVKDAIELAWGNGSETNFALRVLGANASKASVMLVDACTPAPNNLMLVESIGEGGYGDGVAIRCAYSGYKRTDKVTVKGDGSTLPYSMTKNNLSVDATNKVIVVGNGTTVTYQGSNIVYDIGELASGKVYVDLVNGTFQFHAANAYTAAYEITASMKYQTLTVTVSLGGENSEIYRDVIDLIDLEAKMKKGTIVRGTIQPGMTHLPKVKDGGYILTGGSDGDETTTDDWYQAMLRLGDTLRLYAGAPTCIAFCNIETSSEDGLGTRNLLPIITDFLGYMAEMEAPCIGFVGMTEEGSLNEALLFDVGQDFQDRNLVVCGNPWDTQVPRRNGAVASAAKWTAIPLGESAAMDDNAMQGLGPLLFEYNPTTTVALTRRGIDMLEKSGPGGTKPHKGVTTSGVEQWTRIVDQLIINQIIVDTFRLTKRFRFHRNVNLERTSLQNSLKSMLEDQLTAKNIYDYICVVLPHRTNPNHVVIKMQFIPVGHMEYFEVEMGVGVYEDLTKFAGV